MEDAAFTRDRLQTAVATLRERLEEVRAEEEDHRRRLVLYQIPMIRTRAPIGAIRWT